MARIEIYGALAKVVFDKNPDHEFYVVESFPLDWMYPHLSPNGLILKLNRQPLAELPEAMLSQDHKYWARYLRPIIGDWLNHDTPISELAAFVEKVYLRHDLTGFKGDPQFIGDTQAQRAFSKLRSSIGGLYGWRVTQAPPEYRSQSKEQEARLRREADFAFRQALVLCPSSPEALFRYVNLLLASGRADDALLIATSCQKVTADSPQSSTVASLVDSLERMKTEKGPGAKK